MKKLFRNIFFGLMLMISACQSFNNGIKALSTCCKDLSVAKRDKTGDEENKESEYSNPFSLLPVNSWDGKMMIW